MYLRLSVCISLVMFRVVFGIPFISTTEGIESTPSKKWTDMNINESVESVPNYVEYDDEDYHAFNEQIQRKVIPPTDSHNFLKEGEESGTAGTKNSFTLFGNKGINKSTAYGMQSEADGINQQASHLEQTNDDSFKNDNTFESNNELQSSDFLSQMPSSLSDTDLKENEQKISTTAQIKSNLFKGDNHQKDVYKIPSESNVNIESNIQPAMCTYVGQMESTSSSSMDDRNISPVNNIDSQPLKLTQTILEKDASSQQIEHKSLNDFKSKQDSQPILNQVTSTTAQPALPMNSEEKETAQILKESMVSNEMIRYKTVIDEQIGKLERLLRKLEAVHGSGTKANLVDNAEHNHLGVVVIDNPENEEIISKNNIESPRSFQTLKDVTQLQEVQQAHNAQQKTKEITLKDNDLINQYPKQQQQQTNTEKETIVKKNMLKNNKIFRLIQPNEILSAQTTRTKSGLEPNISTLSVIPSLSNEDGTTILFDPSNKIKLPNGSWTPSCKNVSKGFYCLKPDGEDSIMVQCSGENVGSQFSCGSEMMCYSIGPNDVDCQK